MEQFTLPFSNFVPAAPLSGSVDQPTSGHAATDATRDDQKPDRQRSKAASASPSPACGSNAHAVRTRSAQASFAQPTSHSNSAPPALIAATGRGEQRVEAELPDQVPAASEAAGSDPCSTHFDKASLQPSFADALAFVDAAQDLSATMRRDLRSALLTAAKLMGRPPRDIVFSPDCIRASSIIKIPKLFEAKVQRRRNVLSGLRKVAKLMGIIPENRTDHAVLTPQWHALLCTGRKNFNRHKLTRLAQFSASHGIEPAEVTTDIFASFSDEVLRTSITASPIGYLGSAASVWNTLAARQPELGLRKIERAATNRHYTVAMDKFPASFQDELARFRSALAPIDPGSLHDDLDLPEELVPFRPSAPLKPATIKLRMERISYAASALVLNGTRPQDITSLSDLFTPISRVKTIIRYLRERGDKKQSSHIAGVVGVLRQAASFCHADQATQRELARLEAVVMPKQDGVVAKNRERLRAMIEPGTRAIILALPQLLLDAAQKLSDPVAAAHLVRTAVALELLIIAAPRLSNLKDLQVDGSFRRAATGKRQITHMIVDANDVKNGVPIERQLPAESVGLIQLWLDKYRPYLANPGCVWLFPGRRHGPMAKSAFRSWIARAIRDFANVEVHPHLFRHFCAWLHLQYHPSDYEGARRLLGHKSINTTIKAYIAFEQDIAAARYDVAVLKERQATRHVVKQALSRRGPGKTASVRQARKTIHGAVRTDGTSGQRAGRAVTTAASVIPALGGTLAAGATAAPNSVCRLEVPARTLPATARKLASADHRDVGVATNEKEQIDD